VRKSFGKTEIIRGTDLAVRAGERVAIIGPNGAGKSTLFNLISGRFAPTSGEILLNGEAHRRPEAVRDQPAGPVAQLPDHQHLPALSVFENLRCGCCGRWATAIRSGSSWPT
jgi:branched-chain amino acid transport system ATP-binding protein